MSFNFFYCDSHIIDALTFTPCKDVRCKLQLLRKEMLDNLIALFKEHNLHHSFPLMAFYVLLPIDFGMYFKCFIRAEVSVVDS